MEKTGRRRRGRPAAGPAWLAAGLALLLAAGGAAAQEGEAGMCAGQREMTAPELNRAMELMREIMALGSRLNPADEETIIRGRGLSSGRLNCLLGKVMAGNDIFNWGPPAAYGVSLSELEMEIAKSFAGETGPLKKYLEEVLNIKAE
jgi:hypothetical protein